MFEAQFPKQNEKPRWFCRKNVCVNIEFQKMKFHSGLFQELFSGTKYKFKNDGNTYKLIILDPKIKDSAKYTIEIGGVQSSATLTVLPPDPSYTFIKLLKPKYIGHTKHQLTLECMVSSSMAVVSWYKGDMILYNDMKYSIDKNLAGVCKLQIENCDFSDAGDYRCQLVGQPDKTETKVNVIGK